MVYIESPYQLQNALSYLEEYGKKKNVHFVLRLNGNEHQDQQFFKIIKDKSLKNFSYIRLNSKSKLKFLQLIPSLFKIFNKIRNTKFVVIGDGRSIVSKFISKLNYFYKRELIFVDDGLYLLSYVKNIQSKNCTVFTSLPIEKYLTQSKPVNISIQVKKFSAVKVFDSKVVLLSFIGMKLPEIDYMSESRYISYLLKICSIYPQDEIKYYPHRGEDPLKLAKLSQIGFEIVKTDLPLEEYFLQNGAPIGKYVSFYSTAIYNLSEMMKSCDFISIKPPIANWPKEAQKPIEACYELLQNSNITLLELDAK